MTERSRDEKMYAPAVRRAEHALVSGERMTLCGQHVRAIAPGAFDAGAPTSCAQCRRLAEPQADSE